VRVSADSENLVNTFGRHFNHPLKIWSTLIELNIIDLGQYFDYFVGEQQRPTKEAHDG